jgi:uncharacterized protein YmfQ (DUF2313 family)
VTFLRIFKHLLPRARAWRITVDKQLRRLLEGLSGVGADVKDFTDAVWLDLFPQTTRSLEAWEEQFGQEGAGLTEQQRRDNVDAAWKALGGQSPRYIQDTLRDNGFDVYVHEWWTPNAFPLNAFYCGDAAAQSGETGVECTGAVYPARDPNDVLAPDNIVPVAGKGYPLVNLITDLSPNFLALCGEAAAECGEPSMLCYNYVNFNFSRKKYETTADPDTWPYYLYIGGAAFGDLADVPENRRTEFETLCLKICPNQQWLGILVEYI